MNIRSSLIVAFRHLQKARAYQKSHQTFEGVVQVENNIFMAMKLFKILYNLKYNIMVITHHFYCYV